MSVVLDANALVVLALDRQRAVAVEGLLCDWKAEGEELHARCCCATRQRAPLHWRYQPGSLRRRLFGAQTTLPTSGYGSARWPKRVDDYRHGDRRVTMWWLGKAFPDIARVEMMGAGTHRDQHLYGFVIQQHVEL